MTDLWLVSYVMLWVIVIAVSFTTVLLVRELGQRYLNTPEGVSRDGIPIGEQSPAVIAEDLNGKEHEIGRGGLPTLLVFGSAQCNPCRQLVPDLNRFAGAHNGEVASLFVSRGSHTSTLRFAQDTGLTVPIIASGGGMIADLFGARVTPFAFMLDGSGKVIRKGVANNYEHLSMLAFGDSSVAEEGDQEGLQPELSSS